MESNIAAESRIPDDLQGSLAVYGCMIESDSAGERYCLKGVVGGREVFALWSGVDFCDDEGNPLESNGLPVEGKLAMVSFWDAEEAFAADERAALFGSIREAADWIVGVFQRGEFPDEWPRSDAPGIRLQTMIERNWMSACGLVNDLHQRLACDIRSGGERGLRSYHAHLRVIEAEERAMGVLGDAYGASKFS